MSPKNMSPARFTVLLSLPGCHIPGLRSATSGQGVPETFVGTASLENSSQMGFDEFFSDPVLTGLVFQGLDGNQDLKVLSEDIEIASNEVLARKGAYFPFVTFGGRADVDKPGDFTRAGAVESQLSIRPGQAFPEPLPNFMVAGVACSV
jgi:outer membrane protein, multidrug efflux system